MSATIYQPRTDPVARLRRGAARLAARRMVSPRLPRGLISFSFDDCPRSVVDNALPQLEAEGWRATVYAAMGLNGTTNHLGEHMGLADYQAASRAGHEIGDHTYQHNNATTDGVEATLRDIDANQTVFKEAGLPPATTFAFPYGGVNVALKRALSDRFVLLRGVHAPKGRALDLNLAASAPLYHDCIEATFARIREAAADGHWLILFTHDVRERPSDFGCTPDDLEQTIALCRELDVEVLPVADAARKVAA